jgi:hypothetical protein
MANATSGTANLVTEQSAKMSTDFIINLITAVFSCLAVLLQLIFKKDNILDKVMPRPADKEPRANSRVLRKRLDSLHQQVQNLTPSATPPETPLRVTFGDPTTVTNGGFNPNGGDFATVGGRRSAGRDTNPIH